jgi:hypothetical protein
MRCFPILGVILSLDFFPSHWSHLCCASTASISPPSLDGMDISHQRVPPHLAHSISHRNGWSALLRCSSCTLDFASQLGPTPHAHDTIQAIQHIHTTLFAALIRSRLCTAAHYGITLMHVQIIDTRVHALTGIHYVWLKIDRALFNSSLAITSLYS